MAIACAMVIVDRSAWRLAKFNNGTIRETTGFFGLATPANALLWASFGLISGRGYHAWPHGIGTRVVDPEVTASAPAKLVLAIALGILMLSDLSLPGLRSSNTTDGRGTK